MYQVNGALPKAHIIRRSEVCMRWVSVLQISIVAAVSAATFAVVSSPRVEGQARTSAVPRLNGKPDLNGLWQAVNSANWDIQAHSARAALQMRPGPIVPVPAKEIIAMGAAGSVPSGIGVVEGDELPYTADGLKKKQENQANWMTRDPEVKCYLPGVPRASDSLRAFRPAASYPRYRSVMPRVRRASRRPIGPA